MPQPNEGDVTHYIQKIWPTAKFTTEFELRIHSEPLQNQNDFMIKLSFPFTEEKIRALKIGDEVLIPGVVFTGRDARCEWGD